MYYRAGEGASWADNAAASSAHASLAADQLGDRAWSGADAGGAAPPVPVDHPGTNPTTPASPDVVYVKGYNLEVPSWTQPLTAERARGVDGAGGHPHAGHAVTYTVRHWEDEIMGGNYYGLHVLEVPGAWEPAGMLHPLDIPQPITTRVPPPRWDEPFRLPPFGGQDAASSGL